MAWLQYLLTATEILKRTLENKLWMPSKTYLLNQWFYCSYSQNNGWSPLEPGKKQRQMHCQNSTCVTDYKISTWSSLKDRLAVQEVKGSLFCLLSWSGPPPGSLTGLCFSGSLASLSSMKHGWSDSLLNSTISLRLSFRSVTTYIILWRKYPQENCQL